MTSRTVMLRAAQLLEEDAEALHSAHTLNGEWFIEEPADKVAKTGHDERRAIAAKLRLLA